ncbi:MAG: hypothetical protein ABFD83_06390 [Armatimonadota bacterium]
MYSFRQLINNKIPFLVLTIGVMSFLASAACGAGISQNQKDQLKDLAVQTRQRTRVERQNLMRARRELFEAYRSYDLNEKKAKAAIEKIDRSQLKLLHIHLDNQTGIRDILTASQFADFRSRVGNKMRGRRPGAIPPLREGNPDKLVDKTIQEMNLSADQTLPLSKLAEQKDNTTKKIRRDSKQMAGMYAAYNLDIAAAKKLINSIHRQQVNLLNLNFKKQQALRKVLTANQFNDLIGQISRHSN